MCVCARIVRVNFSFLFFRAIQIAGAFGESTRKLSPAQGMKNNGAVVGPQNKGYKHLYVKEENVTVLYCK